MNEWMNPHDTESNCRSPDSMFAKFYCRISCDITALVYITYVTDSLSQFQINFIIMSHNQNKVNFKRSTRFGGLEESATVQITSLFQLYTKAICGTYSNEVRLAKITSVLHRDLYL